MRLVIALVTMIALVTPAMAGMPEYTLVLHHHTYQPQTLKIPAGTKVKLVVENKDATPEEFESTDFSREKLVMPHGKITVYVGPLRKGTYRFFGDFHQATAQGRLIVE
ncbi:cupredoxin domain-containing protein [Oleiagrimonas sp. MCCC 1A03011]|uniref:cupredoxin domain-containing protein n=1 Tax=Oleiagrimonas sp. MCCC 1A03011 TaxID=1926883 RepID=UPI000DC2C463|nr:cupredoxin domain-containing protein [Oleiagrimonas sp. MCCC 1A03011]RAP56103.1 hypothetical protein BTJ49_14785 [Oleiagrimonas sp. MCCC 1A03011]